MGISHLCMQPKAAPNDPDVQRTAPKSAFQALKGSSTHRYATSVHANNVGNAMQSEYLQKMPSVNARYLAFCYFGR